MRFRCRRRRNLHAAGVVADPCHPASKIIENTGLFRICEAGRSGNRWGTMSTYTEGRERDSVMVHRYRFLWAVQELVPEVLEGLARDVFPFFSALFREEPSREPGESGSVIWGDSGVSVATLWTTWASLKEANKKGDIWTGPSWASDLCGVPLESDRLTFRNAMEKWASTYHLCVEWIKEEAFSTLHFWLANPHGKRVWAPRGSSRTIDEMTNVPKLHIDDQWNFEVWSVVNERLQEQIAVYKSEVKKHCVRIGFDLERIRKDRAHHQWLALFQCRGMSPKKIRDWDQENYRRKLDPTAVSHAIESLAKKIGLERRLPRRGPGRSR